MAKIIEARALLTADDQASAKIVAMAKRVDQIIRAQKAFSKAGGDQMLAMAKRVDDLNGKLGRIQGFKKLSSDLDKAAMAQRRAAQEANRLKTALDAAGGSNSKMLRDYERASRAVDRARNAFMSQGQAVRKARTDLDAMGISVKRLAQHERELAQQASASHNALARRMASSERWAKRREVAAGLAATAGVYASHKVAQGGRATLHTYREFDDERRYGKAVMGITDEEQKPLVDQAIHGGATSKYNDIQWLHGQRDLAARGVKLQAILGMMPNAANLGMATGLDLPEAVKMMENAIFTFQKSVGTVEEAATSSKQTADTIVKAMKISGMTPEDIANAYTYGAPSANMGNLGENNLLAFSGILKKAGIGGDQAGTAFRALNAAIFAPTAGAKTALRAQGLNYADYQKSPDRLAVDPFVDNIAAKYGVALDGKAKAAIAKVFADNATIADPAKFTPAIMEVLGEHLGGDDAKSKKSIAGEANRYRDASMQGVDANKMFRDILEKMRGNIGFANKMFGSKQGSRIATALKDPAVFDKFMSMLQESSGYAKNISDERMAGFDGAVSRFEGAIKNLETAVGRAWDKDGQGGPLTQITNYLGQLVQKTAELPTGIVQGLSAALGIAGGAAGAAGAWNIGKLLLTGGGLPASAVALNEAAAALNVAAVRLGAGGVAGAATGAATAGGSTAAGAAAAASTGGKLASLARLGIYGAGAYLTYEGVKAIGDANAKLYENVAPGEVHNEGRRRRKRFNEALRDQTNAVREKSFPTFAGGGFNLGDLSALQNLKAVVSDPIDVTGKLDPVELKGQAMVGFTVKIDGPGQVTSMSSSSSGHVKTEGVALQGTFGRN